MARGFAGWSPSGWMLVKADSSDIVTTRPIAAAATGRQRGDSSRPVGKISGKTVAKPTNDGIQVQRVSQAATR